MTPAARYAAAIDILDRIFAGEPAEKALLAWARGSRFAGSKDRAGVRDIVFDILRRKRSCGWVGGAGTENPTGRQAVLGLILREGQEPEEVFSGVGYAPPMLTAEETGAIGDLADAPRPVALDFPDFLEPELEASLGDDLAPAMSVLQGRGPVDLRVNSLRGDTAEAIASLARDGIEVALLEGVEAALRVVSGPRKLALSRAYKEGLVELQDVASQKVVGFAEALRGQTVLDYCAGGGGKTLALAAAMDNEGRLIAHDVAERRMEGLSVRAERAGARIEVMDSVALARSAPVCDLVLVDAPCSGSGAWRRTPDAKWRLTPERLEALRQDQVEAVEAALRFLAPKGRLIYATCSVLRRENEALVREVAGRNQGLGIRRELRLLPGRPGDGFYCCELSFA